MIYLLPFYYYIISVFNSTLQKLVIHKKISKVVTKSTKNGKIVMDDEEWGKELKKELGLPGDM